MIVPTGMLPVQMTSSNEVLIEGSDAAIAARNGAGMAACYCDDDRLSNPGPAGFARPEAGGMWRFLIGSSNDSHRADGARD